MGAGQRILVGDSPLAPVLQAPPAMPRRVLKKRARLFDQRSDRLVTRRLPLRGLCAFERSCRISSPPELQECKCFKRPFVQRFDSALRLNVHFHVIWLDGVHSHEPGRGGVEWCEHAQVTDADVALLVRRVRNRVRRKLRQMGKWPEDRDAADADVGGGPSDGEQLLLELDAAAVQGVALSGVRAGQRDVRVGRGTRNESFVKGPLCADLEGFSLHGAVRVAAGDRKRLEYLCRYAGRPAIAESRLSRLPDGRVAYSLKKTWRDGSTHVVLSPQVLMERLLALVPRPRRHLVTYHGVLAPGASLRHRVVPQVDEAGQQDELNEFRVEIFTCPNCGGTRRLLAAIQDPDSIERVLCAMGLPFEAPELAVARAPPGGGGFWFGA